MFPSGKPWKRFEPNAFFKICCLTLIFNQKCFVCCKCLLAPLFSSLFPPAPHPQTRETRLNTDIVLRTLQVTFQKNCPSVYQLQYMSWPDRGVPSNPEHVLTMVEEAYHLQGSGPSPLCVHCSVGCGQLLLTQMIPPNFSLFNVVLEMRNQRPAAVQTEEQYRFLYHTVARMFSALQNTNPLYQNFKEVPSSVSSFFPS
uniref:protein-tyrosine-phosphatase n=1 Tax=Canis lupus familiaris TaxID=9615 RepID=A0A8I3PJT3_CANLF